MPDFQSGILPDELLHGSFYSYCDLFLPPTFPTDVDKCVWSILVMSVSDTVVHNIIRTRLPHVFLGRDEVTPAFWTLVLNAITAIASFSLDWH